MIPQGRNQFNQSFIIKFLKPNICKEYFENLTHKPKAFAHYFDRSTFYLCFIKI